jgi:hypothetical protein
MWFWKMKVICFLDNPMRLPSTTISSKLFGLKVMKMLQHLRTDFKKGLVADDDGNVVVGGDKAKQGAQPLELFFAQLGHLKIVNDERNTCCRGPQSAGGTVCLPVEIV